MNITVMSRATAQAYPWKKGDYLISIHGITDKPPMFYTEGRLTIHRFVFDDDSSSFTGYQARKLLLFAQECLEANGELFVHCNAGISRSAGVAEALHRLGIAQWDERDAQAWMAGVGLMPRYIPNSHVVSTILKEAQ